MVANVQLQAPCIRGIRIQDNGVDVEGVPVTLYNEGNNGATTEKTNSQGRIIVTLNNMGINGETVLYTNGDEIRITVGGTGQNKLNIRRC